MLPVTLARVPHHTSAAINTKIRMDTEGRVAAARAIGRAAIHDRLAELREEWDIDRAVELHSGAIAIAGAALSAVNKRFVAVPLVVGASLLVGALFGWSPQYAILRRLGFRTAGEIERERNMLLSKQDGEGELDADVTILDDVDFGSAFGR